MQNDQNAKRRSLAAVLDACWTNIGVRGDASCPELKQHVHCHNCPVYAAAAMQLFEAELAVDDRARWTRQIAEPKSIQEQSTQSIVIFRIGSEWLALPTCCVTEIANPLPVHALPHRPRGAVMGLTSVHGELLICVSLEHMLGLERGPESPQSVNLKAQQRLLLIRRDQVRAVCPVDDVHGIHRFHPRELKEVPATVVRGTPTHSRALLTWRDRSVGVLDDELLFHSLNRIVA
jgi:chemotaxis-related protein WspD